MPIHTFHFMFLSTGVTACAEHYHLGQVLSEEKTKQKWEYFVNNMEIEERGSCYGNMCPQLLM